MTKTKKQNKNKLVFRHIPW